MRIWRISNYADLSGKGGEYKAGRWNYKGDRIVYCADHPSTAMLELLVHVDRDDLPSGFQLIEIDVPVEVQYADPTAGWHENQDRTRRQFRDFADAAKAAVLCVPSVVMPFVVNYLINPAHRDAARLTIVSVTRHLLDPRFRR